jgi:EF hand
LKVLVSSHASLDTFEQKVTMVVVCSYSNILTRSVTFRKISHWAFVQCDTDRTGHIQRQELYAGILLVHIQLAKHVGVAACYPPSRQVMDNLFHAADDNQSGTIDENEFLQIMMIACTQISSRIVVYYAVIILFVPYMTHSIIHALLQMDNYMGFQNETVVAWMEYMLTYGKIFQSIVSLMIFSIVVPYLFDSIDSYSHQAAIEIVVNTTTETTTCPTSAPSVPVTTSTLPPPFETKKTT